MTQGGVGIDLLILRSPYLQLAENFEWRKRADVFFLSLPEELKGICLGIHTDTM